MVVERGLASAAYEKRDWRQLLCLIDLSDVIFYGGVQDRKTYHVPRFPDDGRIVNGTFLDGENLVEVGVRVPLFYDVAVVRVVRVADAGRRCVARHPPSKNLLDRNSDRALVPGVLAWLEVHVVGRGHVAVVVQARRPPVAPLVCRHPPAVEDGFLGVRTNDEDPLCADIFGSFMRCLI